MEPGVVPTATTAGRGMAFFASRKGDLDHIGRIIEHVIEGLGLSPTECRLQQCDSPAWALTHGEVEVYVFLTVGQDGAYLQVVAPLMALPPGNLLPLYRRLLEINAE